MEPLPHGESHWHVSLLAAASNMVAAEWGRIVTISSAASQKDTVGQGHHSATKGSVVALTKAVAQSIRPGDHCEHRCSFRDRLSHVACTASRKKLPPTEVLTKAIAAGRLGTGEARRSVFLSVLGLIKLRDRPSD